MDMIEDINRMFFNFLWDGKGDKITRDIMISDYTRQWRAKND